MTKENKVVDIIGMNLSVILNNTRDINDPEKRTELVMNKMIPIIKENVKNREDQRDILREMLIHVMYDNMKKD